MSTASASDYKPSEQEKTNAAVGLAEYRYFKQNYSPLLVKMRDQSSSDGEKKILRNRANADTFQALTGKNSLGISQVQTPDYTSDMSSALLGQQLQAEDKGAKIQNQRQSNVLGTARKQASDSQSGMATAARLAASEDLAKIKAKQQKQMANLTAAAQIGGSALGKGLENMKTTGVDPTTNKTVKGSFLNPVDFEGNQLDFFGRKK